jgi:septal ring factor EnvC (AmiA/AmiB activator)
MMTSDQPSPRRRARHAGKFLWLALVALIALPLPAAAQDIRGMEVCTAEKQMDRRTSCLQANVEFLQQALSKLAHDTQDKMAASNRDLAAAQAEIAALKTTVEKLSGELAQLKAKDEAARKK